LVYIREHRSEECCWHSEQTSEQVYHHFWSAFPHPRLSPHKAVAWAGEPVCRAGARGPAAPSEQSSDFSPHPAAPADLTAKPEPAKADARFGRPEISAPASRNTRPDVLQPSRGTRAFPERSPKLRTSRPASGTPLPAEPGRRQQAVAGTSGATGAALRRGHGERRATKQLCSICMKDGSQENHTPGELPHSRGQCPPPCSCTATFCC